MRELDTQHPFNRYIEALEQIRATLGTEEQSFYLGLLQTPIKDRYSMLMQQALRLSAAQRLEAVRALSGANVTLQQGRKEKI